jgi:hypothetical protein
MLKKGVQIFWQSRNHLQLLGAWRVTYSKFHTETKNFGLIYKPHYYMEFSAWFMQTFLYLRKTNRNNLGKIIIGHYKKFSRLRGQAPGSLHPWFKEV